MFTQQKIDSELTLLLSATANYQALLHVATRQNLFVLWSCCSEIHSVNPGLWQGQDLCRNDATNTMCTGRVSSPTEAQQGSRWRLSLSSL